MALGKISILHARPKPTWFHKWSTLLFSHTSYYLLLDCTKNTNFQVLALWQFRRTRFWWLAVYHMTMTLKRTGWSFLPLSSPGGDGPRSLSLKKSQTLFQGDRIWQSHWCLEYLGTSQCSVYWVSLFLFDRLNQYYIGWVLCFCASYQGRQTSVCDHQGNIRPNLD